MLIAMVSCAAPERIFRRNKMATSFSGSASVAGSTVELTTFKSKGKDNIIWHELTLIKNKQRITKVWCKLCRKYSKDIQSHPTCKVKIFPILLLLTRWKNMLYKLISLKCCLQKVSFCWGVSFQTERVRCKLLGRYDRPASGGAKCH